MRLLRSAAVRKLLAQVAREKVLPFEPLVPSAETVTAMTEARCGNLATFESVDALMADLHTEDQADRW
jgi:DNA-damage-inducible protein J